MKDETLGCPPVNTVRLLIVDDYAPFLITLRTLLLTDHEVVAADGGESALGILAEDDRFDAYLLDLNMPGTSGIEVFRLLRERGQGDRVIFMTGAVEAPVVNDFLGRLPNLTLEKPFTDTELTRALRAVGPR